LIPSNLFAINNIESNNDIDSFNYLVEDISFEINLNMDDDLSNHHTNGFQVGIDIRFSQININIIHSNINYINNLLKTIVNFGSKWNYF